MARDSANDVVRADRRRNRIPAGSVCAECGINYPTVLESHHIGGRRNDVLTVTLCRNHHTLITEDLRVAGVSMCEPQSPIEALIAVLAGIAEFLHRLADRLTAWSEWLARAMELLDIDTPEWRDVLRSLPSVDDLLSDGSSLR
jgi:hypothetical protein